MEPTVLQPESAALHSQPTKQPLSPPLRPSAAGTAINATPTVANSPCLAVKRAQSSPSSSSVTAPSSPPSASDTAVKHVRYDDGPPIVLPSQYEVCPVDCMVVLMANMLTEIIETNDAMPLSSLTPSSTSLTRFHSRTAPGISVIDYLRRLARHATLTPPLLLAILYYIDRLCIMYPDFNINTLTVHRFLITAATVASKGLSDSFWNNSTYARVGGVRVAELNLLELEFLYRVDWRIVPNPDVLEAYYQGLVERHPGYVLAVTAPVTPVTACLSDGMGTSSVSSPASRVSPDAGLETTSKA